MLGQRITEALGRLILHALLAGAQELRLADREVWVRPSGRLWVRYRLYTTAVSPTRGLCRLLPAQDIELEVPPCWS